MDILITLIVAVLVFALLWYVVGLLPDPPIRPTFKQILYILLILIAIVWLITRFMGGAVF